MPETLFVSYAHEDKTLCEQFTNHLSVLRDIGMIEVWYDGEILPGYDWYEKIMQGLNSASIIVFLISSDFLSSEFVKKEEIPRALNRRQTGEATVVPVILRKCNWDLTALGSLQALPKDALPVRSWPDQDEAFENVARGILQVIRTMQQAPSKDPSSESAPTKGRVIEVDQRGPAEPLFGREEDLRRALDLLRHQAFAITGIKGIGKSKLASALFEQATPANGFPFRTYYWRRFIPGRAPAFGAFARRLVKDITYKDIPTDQMEPSEQVKWVTTTIEENKCLLVIDQFEEVMDERTMSPKRGYEEYGEMLRDAWEGFGDARMVVTTWGTPRTSGSLPFNHLSLSGIASTAVPTFLGAEMHTTENPLCEGPFGELIRRVDGHPLALKLIARNYSFIRETANLSDSTLLDGTVKDIAAKIVSEAYSRVSQPDCLRVLASTCIFSEPCDLLGISWVAESSLAGAHSCLEDLAQMGLISSLPGPTYDVHSLVREHVLENLTREEKIGLHRKAAEFFLDKPPVPPEQRRSIVDVQPFLSAIHHLMAAGAYREAGDLFLTDALQLQLYRWGHASDLAGINEQFLKEDLPVWMAGIFYGNLGLVYRDLGKLDEALAACENSLRLGEQADCDRVTCAALINLGDVHYYRYERDGSQITELEQSLECHQRAERLLERINNPYLDQRNCGCLGNVFRAKSEIDKARYYFRKARDLCVRIQKKECDGTWAKGLGNLYWYEQDARRCEGIWIGGLGNCCYDEKDFHKAVDDYEKAIAIAEEEVVGDKRHASWWRGTDASAYECLGELDKAKDLLEKALPISESIHYSRGIRQQSIALARICHSLGEYMRSMELYNKVIESSKQMADLASAEGYRSRLLEIFAEKAVDMIKQDNIDDALHQAESVFDQPQDRARLYARMGGICRGIGREYLGKGIECYSLAIATKPEAAWYQGRANCHADTGNLEQAIANYSEAIRLDCDDVISILSKMEVEIRAGRYTDAVTTYESLPLGTLSPVYRVIADYMISIALCLQDLPYRDYLGALQDVTVNLGEASWNFGDVEQYLRGLVDSGISLKTIENALAIHDMLKPHLEGRTGVSS